MKEEVYNYLHEYGFDAIEINEIEKKNENIFYTTISEVKKNLSFLEEKYLSNDEIINIINNNPFMLTEKNNRLEALDTIYSNLNIDHQSLKELIKSNSKAYTISPIELEKIVTYLKQYNLSIDTIKNLIIKNPQIISMKFEEFKTIVNFN